MFVCWALTLFSAVHHLKTASRKVANVWRQLGLSMHLGRLAPEKWTERGLLAFLRNATDSGRGGSLMRGKEAGTADPKLDPNLDGRDANALAPYAVVPRCEQLFIFGAEVQPQPLQDLWGGLVTTPQSFCISRSGAFGFFWFLFDF